jgi:hypothetical protein
MTRIDPNLAARDRAATLAQDGRDPRTVARGLSLQGQGLDALARAVEARVAVAGAEEALIAATQALADADVRPAAPGGESPEAMRVQARRLRQDSERLALEGGRLAAARRLPDVEGGSR